MQEHLQQHIGIIVDSIVLHIHEIRTDFIKRTILSQCFQQVKDFLPNLEYIEIVQSDITWYFGPDGARIEGKAPPTTASFSFLRRVYT